MKSMTTAKKTELYIEALEDRIDFLEQCCRDFETAENNADKAYAYLTEEYKKLREAHKELQFIYEEVVEAHGGKEEIAKLITFAHEYGSDVA